MAQKAKALDEAIEKLERLEGLKKELEEQNLTLKEAKEDMFLQLQTEQDKLSDAEERIEQLIGQKGDFTEKLKDLEERLADEEGIENICKLFKSILLTNSSMNESKFKIPNVPLVSVM